MACSLGTMPKVADSHSCILSEGKASPSQESRLLTPNSVLQKPILRDRQLGAQLQESKGQGWLSRTTQKIHSVNLWHGQMLPILVGLRRFPRSEESPGEYLEQEKICGAGTTVNPLSRVPSPMALKVQNFSQDSANICPGTELLSEHSELLFSLSPFFFFSSCNVASEEQKRKRCKWRPSYTGKWQAQVCEEDRSIQLSIGLETAWTPVSISVLCRAIRLPPLTPAWSKASVPSTCLSCNALDTSKSKSQGLKLRRSMSWASMFSSLCCWKSLWSSSPLIARHEFCHQLLQTPLQVILCWLTLFLVHFPFLNFNFSFM